MSANVYNFTDRNQNCNSHCELLETRETPFVRTFRTELIVICLQSEVHIDAQSLLSEASRADSKREDKETKQN